MSCFNMYNPETLSSLATEMKRKQVESQPVPLQSIYQMDLGAVSERLSQEQRNTLKSLRASKSTPDGAIYYLLAAQVLEEMNADPAFANNSLQLTDLGVSFSSDPVAEKYGAFVSPEKAQEVRAEAAAFLALTVKANQYFADRLKEKAHNELMEKRAESREAIRAQLAKTGRVFSFQSAMTIAENWKAAGYEVRMEGVTNDPVAMLEKGVRIVGKKGDEEREVLFLPDGKVWVHADATTEVHGVVSDRVAAEVARVLFSASFVTGAPVVMQTVSQGQRNSNGTSLPFENSGPTRSVPVNQPIPTDPGIWDRRGPLKN